MQERTERDSMGEVQVPGDAYWGAQTQRALHNFSVSPYRFERGLIRALGLIKRAAAEARAEQGGDDQDLWQAIARAAGELEAGAWDEQMVLDVYQTGSGTSTHMNANEVIARRATELLHGDPEGQPRIHPNDHVNRGHSSNDVFPSAMHIATACRLGEELLPALERLGAALEAKAGELQAVVKIGRTHLQDATPISLGQEFSGYQGQLQQAHQRICAAREGLYPLPLGGTAVGTGLNSDAAVTIRTIELIAHTTELPFQEAENHFAVHGARDALVHCSAALRGLAVALTKIANDIRWLGSGPRCGLGEIELPALQPGSSIMPGKVNPVLAEALLMVCARVQGNDATVALAGGAGNFELNVMLPLIHFSITESISLLSRAMDGFTEKCVRGIRAREAACRQSVERSLALVTSLVPELGYERAAALARQAWKEDRTIRELLAQSGEVDRDVLERLLDARHMTGG